MTISTSSNQYNEVTPINIKQYGLIEMDGAGQVVELQGQGVQELEHRELPVELQTHQLYHRDEAWN